MMIIRDVCAYEAAVIIRYRLSARAFGAIRDHWANWDLKRFREALRGVPSDYRTKYVDTLSRDMTRLRQVSRRSENDTHAVIYAKGVGPQTVHELRRVFLGADDELACASTDGREFRRVIDGRTPTRMHV